MKNNTAVSDAAKLLTSHLVALVAASVTYAGMLSLAGKIGTGVGKRLASVVGPLITSPKFGRRLLGFALLSAGASVTVGVVGAGGSAIVMGTFVGVEKLVADALADEDWTVIDGMADELEREFEDRKATFQFYRVERGLGEALVRAAGYGDEVDTWVSEFEDRAQMFKIQRAIFGVGPALRHVFLDRPLPVTEYDTDQPLVH